MSVPGRFRTCPGRFPTLSVDKETLGMAYLPDGSEQAAGNNLPVLFRRVAAEKGREKIGPSYYGAVTASSPIALPSVESRFVAGSVPIQEHVGA